MVVMARESVVIAEVFCGIDSGKRAEIVNKMWLVKVAAVQRDIAPTDRTSSGNLFQYGLESSYAAKNLRSHSYVLLEQFDEAPRTEPCFVRDFRNPCGRRSRQKFPHRILDHRLPFQRARGAFEKRDFHNVQFFR